MALKNYKDNKLSLGSLAKRLDLTVAETLDLLAEFGIITPIDDAEFFKGYEIIPTASDKGL
ncbi:MAG: hypothetical protein HY203_04350 [Nitrospirae bacterium]|nr:hypothetical protein [Nitrospirota bacterium]